MYAARTTTRIPNCLKDADANSRTALAPCFLIMLAKRNQPSLICGSHCDLHTAAGSSEEAFSPTIPSPLPGTFGADSWIASAQSSCRLSCRRRGIAAIQLCAAEPPTDGLHCYAWRSQRQGMSISAFGILISSIAV